MAYYWEQIKLLQLDLTRVIHTIDLKMYGKFLRHFAELQVDKLHISVKIDKELPKHKCYKQPRRFYSKDKL